MQGRLFRYENIRLDEHRKSVFFDYTLETDEESFSMTESLTFPVAIPENDVTNRLLRALHLALGISYYKSYIPPKIVHGYSMSEQEAEFWNTVFLNGLGEFLYKNNLSAERIAKFQQQEGTIVIGSTDTIAWKDTVLLGIGGGKDSIVAGELFKELDIAVESFVLATGNNTGQAQAVADVMGVPLHVIQRRLDPQIIELNKRDDALNGHIPISLIFALAGSLLAVSKGIRSIVVANEASASIPQTVHEDRMVNHQWSKSLDFEMLFQNFIHEHVSQNLDYFSAIRPLTSIAVAKLFANYPQYLEVFTSDNAHFKQDKQVSAQQRWSDNSPKSLSSFILLAPFVKADDMLRAFGKNFLDDASLEPLLLALLGIEGAPVLDCVGTPDELRLCASMIAEQEIYSDTVLIKMLSNRGLLISDTTEMASHALELGENHALPSRFAFQIMNKCKERLT